MEVINHQCGLLSRLSRGAPMRNASSDIAINRLIAIIACCSALVAPASVHAGSSFSLGLPGGGVNIKNPSGLQIRLFSHWVEASGYRPIMVEVISPVPMAADRNLTLTIQPNGWQPASESSQIAIRLPQGAMRAQAEMMLPQSHIIQMLKIETRENGAVLEDLTGNFGIARTLSSWEWSEGYPTVLFIDTDAPVAEAATSTPRFQGSNSLFPNIVEFAPLLPDHSNGGAETSLRERWAQEHLKRYQNVIQHQAPIDDDYIYDHVRRMSRFDLLPPQSLSADKLAYSGIDLTVVSLDDLKHFREREPLRFAAFREYLLGGGTLIVLGLSDDQARARCHELLRPIALESSPSSSPSSATSDSLSPSSLEWRMPSPSAYGDSFATLLGAFNPRLAGTTQIFYDQYGNPTGTNDSADDFQAEAEEGIDEKKIPAPKFQFGQLGLGRIVAIEGTDLDDLDTGQWAWMFRSLGLQRLQWFQRHGLSQQRQNRDFYDFMIPGVGAAPVKGFLGVITVFMIVIGPLNYLVLARFRRLYWLLLTVPLGALLVTGSLYGFALFKDGLGTRARVRSYSELLPTGEVAAWSRQAYYAGVAPSSGLVYPRTATVLPIEFDPNLDAGGNRVIEFSKENLRFTGGYLRSRATSQHLVMNVAKTSGELRIRRDADEKPPTVANELTCGIDQLLILDDGEAYWTSALAEGKSTTTQAISIEDARKRLLDLFTEHQATMPTGFNPQGSNGWQGRRYYGETLDHQFSLPNASTSLLERGLVDIINDVDPGKVPMGRHFIAIALEAPDFVPLGVQSARQMAGFHVIRGHW
jgi:hypothetical protein